MFRRLKFAVSFLAVLSMLTFSFPALAAPASWGRAQPAQQPAAAPQVAGVQVFEALLSGANEVPAVTTPATGRAVMVLDSDMTTLHYRVMVSDISNVTASHIHQGAPGVNGPIIFPLYTGSGVFDPQNPISGTLTLSSTQVADLVAGNYYVNVHTTANPGGEIRGQLAPFTPPADFNAVLEGLRETPPVDTPATGEAHFVLNSSMDELQYEIAVSDIISITASHLHTGWPGQAGPIVIPLYTGGGTFDPGHPLTGTASLSSQNLMDLLTGYLYANVHTSAHPGGEIRGQVGSGYHAFKARLIGSSEIPPHATGANGQALMVLDRDMSTLHYRVMVSDISNITASHIHKGEVNENGPIIFPLYTGVGVFDPANPISGTLTLSSTAVADLVAGNYYVNVHTTQYPGGEIRGQLNLYKPQLGFTAVLSGTNEVPPVDSPASGEAHFSLTPSLEKLNFEISVTNTISITAAHLHPGWPGQVGPPVVPLYNGTGLFDPNHPLSGTVDVTAQNVLDLLSGYLYANVHTEAHPSGEIRGQVLPQIKFFLPVVAKTAVLR